ncbi:PilZ domain-containing protein [Desulfoluna sp.]|uniref:PilZ domain-containing protein n=1 Tax=Desulfoluna sp. TaxID=2045199 RepID=UPI00262E332F|nr:PilZ domain-containing protein [Desulfoluna sp.]
MEVNERDGTVVKRSYDRKSCFFTDVDYALTEGVYSDPIRDISLGGVYIETDNGPSTGERVQMLFSDYSGVDLVKISGDVVRHGGSGFAVRFLWKSSTEFEKLKSYINNL